MTEPGRERFEFDAFRLDAAERLLLRDGEPVLLEPKVFETLLVLIRQARRLVAKEELMRAVWPDSFVEESNLTRNISVLRKVLSPHDGGPDYIETVPKYGYRFVGEVRALAGECVARADDNPTRAGRADIDRARLRRVDVSDVPRHNLPEQLNSFVGREREISEIGQLLASTRLLTLTGAGGCGKTRLALKVAAASLPRFEDGAWLVELAPLSDANLVTQSVATVLGVREGPTRSLRDSVVEYLQHRHLLLLLDNCEHMVAACAELAEALVRGAPHLRILATSREGLGISGETVRYVPPLLLPDTSRSLSHEALLECEAARLFVERAAVVDPSLTIDQHHVATIADICHRLDGIPLAIELAAARVNVLSVEQINNRLSDRFRLLTGGSRTSVPRQRTLEGTVDWSYELLSEPERRVLSALSVFSGSWSLEAAEEVCAGDGVERGEVLDVLANLVGKSLVVVEDDGRGAARRYRYLETVRQYGHDRLMESGDTERVRLRHLGFFFALARRSEPELMGLRQASWLKQLHLEHDNLRAALDWCLSPAQLQEHPDWALDFATALGWYWVKRGLFCRGTPMARPGGGDGSRIVPSATSQGMGCPCKYGVLPGRLRRDDHLCDERYRARPGSGRSVQRRMGPWSADDRGGRCGRCRHGPPPRRRVSRGGDRERKPMDSGPGSLRAGISRHPRG